MNRISDERLETMLDIERVSPVQAHSGDWHRDVSIALRELLVLRERHREVVGLLRRTAWDVGRKAIGAKAFDEISTFLAAEQPAQEKVAP